MAALTGTFNTPHDLLASFQSFITTTGGWTQNQYTTGGVDGDVLHIQKTIGTNTFYFNFLSMTNQNYYGSGSWPNVYGLAVAASTGYDALESVMEQPGGYGTFIGVPDCTSVAKLDATATSRAFRFVALDDFFSVHVEDSFGEYQHILCVHGTESYGTFGNGFFGYWGSLTVDRILFMQGPPSTSNTYDNASKALRFGSSWVLESNSMNYWFYNPYTTSTRIKGPIVASVINDFENPKIGPPVLFPFAVAINSGGLTYAHGKVDGFYALNKHSLNNGEVIVIGSESYAVYKANYNYNDYGIAVKVS